MGEGEGGGEWKWDGGRGAGVGVGVGVGKTVGVEVGVRVGVGVRTGYFNASAETAALAVKLTAACSMSYQILRTPLFLLECCASVEVPYYCAT